MRWIPFLLLALISAPAQAEWTKLGENDAVTYFVDASTIYKKGIERRVWLIQELKQRDKEGVMSVRGLLQLDCKEGKYRFLSSATYPLPMAGGEALWNSDEVSDWESTPPNLVVANILKFVCET